MILRYLADISYDPEYRTIKQPSVWKHCSKTSISRYLLLIRIVSSRYQISRCDTYRDTWVTMRYVSRYLGHNVIRIVVLGSQCDTYRDTWVTMRYVSRYLGHNAIRIVVLGSQCDTYRGTWVTMRYVSRYFGHNVIRIAVLGLQCDTYRGTWVTLRYVSRYLGHNAIRIAVFVYRVNQCLLICKKCYEAWQCNLYNSVLTCQQHIINSSASAPPDATEIAVKKGSDVVVCMFGPEL